MKYVQIPQKLLIDREIDPVKPEESFCYLGRHFDFSMSNAKHK